jgi:hypothetical protein
LPPQWKRCRRQRGSITYTLTTVGSGQLNGVSFTARAITLTGTADTAEIDRPPCCLRNLLTLSFSVAGLGGGTFLDLKQVVSNRSQGFGNASAGFGDVTRPHAILFLSDPAFATYDLPLRSARSSAASRLTTISPRRPQPER